MGEVRVSFDGNWVASEYLQAAMEDLIDMLADVARGKRASATTEAYTWMFVHRGKRVTLEITARRVS